MSTESKHKSRAQMIKNGRGCESEEDEDKSKQLYLIVKFAVYSCC